MQKKRHLYCSLLLAVFLQLVLCVPAFAASNPIKNGWYMIQSGNSVSRVLDINNYSLSNGGNLETYQKNGTSNQVFYLQYLNNGYYSIRAAHSGKYIHVQDERNKTSNVHQWDGNSNANAQWKLEGAGSGYYYLKSRSTGSFLDNVAGRTTNGNNVKIWTSKAGANQKWKFISVNRPTFGGNISNHSSLSGSYNKNSSKQISAQLSMNYPVTKLQVVVYNSSGKNMSMTGTCYPNSRSFKINHTFNFSKLAAGSYYYRIISYNALGDKSTTGKYNFTIKSDVASTLKLTNYTTPGTINQGSGFTCKGTVSSNYKITKVTVGIWDASNKAVTTYSVYPNAYSYDINKLDSEIHFSWAKPGTNYYEVWARDEKQTKCLLNKAFTVREVQLVSVSEISSAASRYGISTGSNAYKALQSINTKYYSKLSSNKAGINIFMFEGVGIRGTTTNNGTHGNAMCVVVKNGRIVYINKNCTTIPNAPFNSYSHPTLKGGIHNFVAHNHLGNYAALQVRDNSNISLQAPVIRYNPNTRNWTSNSRGNGVNVHSGGTSEGCQLIDSGNYGSGEYTAFCKAVGIVNSSASYIIKKSGSKYLFHTVDNTVSGKIIIDRSFAKSYLKAVGYPDSVLQYLSDEYR